MKIKLCPKCGKQNDVDAWNCVDCGSTLSINTIVEAGDLPSSRVAIAGKGVLFGISPFFQDDLTELIKISTSNSETIVKGCDICIPSVIPPFKFGFLILTSIQLLCVRFNSEKRPCLQRHMGEFVEGRILPRIGEIQYVSRPDHALTMAEKASKEVISYSRESLYSCELANDIHLHLKFQTADRGSLTDFSVTFYFNDEAYGIYSSITDKVKL